MKRYIYFTFFLCFISFIISNCADFDKFSDEADILSINIYDLDSTNINIVGKEINTNAATLTLHVKGKLNKFPLELKTRFTTSPNSSVFRGSEYQTLMFNQLSDTIGVMVIAQSGLPKKWVIQLADLRNEASEIEQAEVLSYTPEDIVLKNPPITIYKNLRRIELFIEEGENRLPLTVKTSLTLSSKAILTDTSGHEQQPEANNTVQKTFTFPDLSTTHPFCILSEAGDTSRWTFALRTKYSNDADILDFRIKDYIPSNIEFGDIRIDHLNSEVVIKITGGVFDPSTFMVSMSQPEITTSPGTTISAEYTGDLNFESLTKVPQIILISENEQQRIWSFKLEYPFGPAASFQSFSVTQTTPAEIILDKAGVIDPVNHTIQLKVTKGVKKFPLTLNAEANCTNNGELLDPLNKLYFKDINASNTIRVRSSNAEITLWNIILRDMESEQSAENAITEMSVSNVVPSGITMDRAILNTTTHEITLPIKKRPVEDAGKPIMLETKFKISEGAYIVNNTNFIKEVNYYLGSLRFESLAAVNEIKIEAANGESQIWKIKLSYTPQTGCDIRSFAIESYTPAEFKLGSFIDLNKENQTITISLTDGLEHFPLTITPEITLSENARIISGNSYRFEKISDIVKVLVSSESGQEKIWTIKLKNDTHKSSLNNIESFKIYGILPEADIQATTIDPVAATVTVHLANTTYPLVLSADIEVSENASIQLPLYSYKFENASQNYPIFVKAQNGAIKNWKLILEDATAKSALAEITKAVPVSISPAYNNIGKVSIDNSKANINVEIYEGATYPTILQMSLEVSPLAKIQPPYNNPVFQFTNNSTPVSLQIQAENGTLKTWTITPCPIPQPAQAIKLITAETNEGNLLNNIKQVTLSSDRKIEVYNLIPGVQDRILRLTFNNKVSYSIISAKTFRTLRNGEQYNSVIEIPLSQLNTDGGQVLITDENGASATYTIILKYTPRPQSDLAEVSGFRINQLRPLNISMPGVNINSGNHEVILDLDNKQEFQPFSFIADIETSPYSSLVGINNGQNLEFDRTDKVIRFSVKSESSGVINEWTIRLNYESHSKNDKAEVETFGIVNSLPKEIKTGTPVVDKNTKVINIDILSWTKNQTLYLTPQATLSSGATSDLAQVLSFDNPNGSSTFTITAENGQTAVWTIKLNFTAGSDADVTRFGILSHLPAEVELNYTVQINKSLQEVVIPVIKNLHFPIRIRPEIQVSQGATALNIPLEYVFNSLTDVKTLQVEAEDGFIKEWKIRMAYTFNSEANVLDMNLGSAAIPVSIGNIRIQSGVQLIEVNINNWNGYSEFSIAPQFTLSQGATLQGIGQTITFTKKTAEEVKFIVVAEDQTTRKEWTIRLVYQESANTNLALCMIDTYSPKEIQLKANGEIDNAKAIVYIDIDKWNGNKELTISKYTLNTADNARVVNLPATLSFTKETKESIAFKVRAQNDITERNWSLRLRYTEVSNAQVTAFNVTGSNRPSLVLGTPEIGNQVITVPVTRGVRDGFASSYLIQANVIINENGVERTQPVNLSFISVSDSKTFTVTDEFGQKKTWTVQLNNQASNQAEIASFNPRAFTSTSPDLKYLKHSQTGNSYKVYVSDIATKERNGNDIWPLITLNAGAIQLSDLAVSNVNLQMSFNVTTYDLKKNFTVTADDGVTTKDYSIEFIYCPQFENSNFSQWYVNSDKVNQIGVAGKPSFWTTANMEYSGAINDGSSPYSSQGARLYSKEVGIAGINKFAAASLYLGTFRKPTSISEATGSPTALTTFGVQFRGRPVKVQITCSYNVDYSKDHGEIWVAGNYQGHSENRENADAYGTQWFGTTNGLQTFDVPIAYKQGAQPLKMLTISLSSSYLGAEFKGEIGAEFIVTKIELIYE